MKELYLYFFFCLMFHCYFQITFASVGGLGKHVRALKEMVVFPLLYPEIFDRFKIAPPRGVLFYGPPGTSIFVFYDFSIYENIRSSGQFLSA